MPVREPAAEPPPVVPEPAADAGEPPRPWATPMPPPPSQGAHADERPMPSHLFDQPPAGRRSEEPAAEADQEIVTEPGPEAEADEEARPPYPPGPRHAPPDKDAGIADAAADAIDRLARTLFGPKRRR